MCVFQYVLHIFQHPPREQPRGPFAGTIWNGTLNGFPRIDQENLRRPSGGKPNGYVWSMKINGWRRTLAQTLADEARMSEQSRMRAPNLNSRGTNLELSGENVPNHSLLEISWYIVAMGTNAPLAWFDVICTAWENAIVKCGSPAEVDGRAELARRRGAARRRRGRGGRAAP